MGIIERLVRMNKSLLLLTKIENKQFLEVKPISIKHSIHQIANELDEIINFKDLKVSYHEKTMIEANLDPTLSSILLSNLFRNAIFHSPPGNEIEITLSNRFLIFSNPGDGKALDTEKIFQRFYRAENQKGGTGLGLAIVQAICTLYQIELIYYYEQDRHHFKLIFPA